MYKNFLNFPLDFKKIFVIITKIINRRIIRKKQFKEV